MELKEGMFVRTNEGIGTIHKMYGDKIYNIKFKKGHIKKWVNILREPNSDVTKLIEAGDILCFNNRKHEVVFDESLNKLACIIPGDNEFAVRHIAIKYIFEKYKVSILTHEQFENMKYEVNNDLYF